MRTSIKVNKGNFVNYEKIKKVLPKSNGILPKLINGNKGSNMVS